MPSLETHHPNCDSRQAGASPARASVPCGRLPTSDERSFSAERNLQVSEQSPTKSTTWISDWRPEDETFWNSTGKFVARRNLIWSIVAENIGFSVWLIWSIVATKLPAAGFHYSTDRAVSAGGDPRTDRLADALSLHFCRHHVRRPQLDHLQRLGAVDPDLRSGLFRQPSRNAVLADAAGGVHRRSRRRQFCLQHGQHLLLLSRPHEGLGARPQRRRRQYRRQQRAVADADPDGRRPDQSLSGLAGRGRLSAERRPDVGAAV